MDRSPSPSSHENLLKPHTVSAGPITGSSPSQRRTLSVALIKSHYAGAADTKVMLQPQPCPSNLASP